MINKNKLIKYLLLTLFTIMIVAGCSKSVEIQEVSSTSEEQDAQQEQVDKSKQDDPMTEGAISVSTEEMDEKSGQSAEPKDTEAETKNTENEAKNTTNEPAEEKEVASVIVKSENNLSDSEKQEIITLLSKEVEDLLKEINAEE